MWDLVEVAAPIRRFRSSPQTKTYPAENLSTELMEENKALKMRLQQVTWNTKMKQLINEEEELVMLRLRHFVKEQLWKKVKFITDYNMLERALTKCAIQFGVEDKEKLDWKLQMAWEVQQSINNRHNNCTNNLSEAYTSK